MRASRLWIASGLLAWLVACGVSAGHMADVLVPGDASDAVKLQIAEAVGRRVLAGLGPAVLQRFPTLTKEELNGLQVRWATATFRSLTSDRPARTQVVIQCVFQQARPSEIGQPVVEFCKQTVEATLKAFMEQVPARRS